MNNRSFKNVTVAELTSILQRGDLRLVDVRTDAEIVRGRIPQGDPLPLHLFPMRLHELDKDMPTVFYCQMGGRSAQAADQLRARGFTSVRSLCGGTEAWLRRTAQGA